MAKLKKIAYLDDYGPITGYGSKYWKPGLDVDLKIGDPVKAPKEGEVVKAGAAGGFGNQVVIKDRYGNETMLSHLDKINVKPGDKIAMGQAVGLGGNTGKTYSTSGGDGSHLDLTVKTKDGKYMTAKQAEQYVSYEPEQSPILSMKDFNIKVDNARKAGKSDTQILNTLSKVDKDFKNRVDIMRSRMVKGKTEVKNDKDLLNFISMKLSGKMPTVESVPDQQEAINEQMKTVKQEYAPKKKGFFGGIKQLLTKPGEFFKPKADDVRIRDVLREGASFVSSAPAAGRTLGESLAVGEGKLAEGARGIAKGTEMAARNIPGATLGKDIKSAISWVKGEKRLGDIAKERFSPKTTLVETTREAVASQQKSRENLDNLTNQAQIMSNALKAAGKDTRGLDRIIKESKSEVKAGELQNVQAGINKTTKEIVGTWLGVAADVLSFGSYGKAAKGAESFKLLTPEANRKALLAGKYALDKGFLKGTTDDMARKAETVVRGSKLTTPYTGEITSKAGTQLQQLANKNYSSPLSFYDDALDTLAKNGLANNKALKDSIRQSVMNIGQYTNGGIKLYDKVKPVKTATQAFIKGFLSGGGKAAPISAMFGASEALKDNKTAKEVIKETGTGVLTGLFIGGLLEGATKAYQFKAPEKAAKLKEKAIEQYKKGLKATKEKYKEKTDKVVQELLDQEYKGTFKKIMQKADDGIALSSDEYAKLGELQGMIEIDGLIDEIDKVANTFKSSSGKVISTNKTRYNTLMDLRADILSYQEKLSQQGKMLAKQEELRRLARSYGADLYDSRKAQKTINDSKTLSQVKKVDSNIRTLLNKNNPKYAEINKVYHLNNELKDILMETAKRKEGQSVIKLVTSVTGGAGGIIGAATGGLGGAAAGAITTSALTGVLNSTWWNTTSAVRKNKIANKLLEMNQDEISAWLVYLYRQGARAANELLAED